MYVTLPMITKFKSLVFLAVAVLAYFFYSKYSSFELPILDQKDFDPDLIDSEAYNSKKEHKIPDFEFLDQEGKVFSNKDLDGKIYIADFFFTSCAGICPIMTRNMFKIQQEFFNDSFVKIVSHTVHPEKDSVAVLNEYAKLNNIDSKKWHLLTGDKKELYDIARKGYFAVSKVDDNIQDAFIHTENFILVDNNQRIRGVYNGTLPYEITRLIEDIYFLKQSL
ncbi:MAG: SCO family protein [Candidatus Neomarinimicrobiota bacterium]|nr:MAG: SCO family protein [Candidatus Neomarinimicrobiota bacterium]